MGLTLMRDIYSLTLNGLRREACQLKRRLYAGQQVRIWEGGAGGWWLPRGRGLTSKKDDAGIYRFEHAVELTKFCEFDARIVFQLVKADEISAA